MLWLSPNEIRLEHSPIRFLFVLLSLMEGDVSGNWRRLQLITPLEVWFVMVRLELVLHTVAASAFFNWEQVASPRYLAVGRPQERGADMLTSSTGLTSTAVSHLTVTVTACGWSLNTFSHVGSLKSRQSQVRLWVEFGAVGSTPPPACRSCEPSPSWTPGLKKKKEKARF